MSSNNGKQPLVPSAREAMNKFKMEAANEVGVNLKQGYNGDLTIQRGRLRRRPDGQEDDPGLRERHAVTLCPSGGKRIGQFLRELPNFYDGKDTALVFHTVVFPRGTFYWMRLYRRQGAGALPPFLT